MNGDLLGTCVGRCYGWVLELYLLKEVSCERFVLCNRDVPPNKDVSQKNFQFAQ